jgi:hypothetical protein
MAFREDRSIRASQEYFASHSSLHLALRVQLELTLALLIWEASRQVEVPPRSAPPSY